MILIMLVVLMWLVPWAAVTVMRVRAARITGQPSEPIRASAARADTPAPDSAPVVATSNPMRGRDPSSFVTPCKELQALADRLAAEPLPSVATTLIQWGKVERVRVELVYLRTQRPLTDFEKSMDPDTHPDNEVWAALCPAIERFDVLPALEAEAREKGHDFAKGNYAIPLDLILRLLRRQVSCMIHDGTPEEALDRCVRMMLLEPHRIPFDGVPVLTQVLDRFPGAVPKPLQGRILECFPGTPDSADLGAELAQVSRAYDNPRKPKTLKDAFVQGSVLQAAYAFVRLDNENYFRQRAKPPSNAGMETCRNDLNALLNQPPTHTCGAIKAITERIPSTSYNVKSYFDYAVSQYRFAWRDVFYRDVLALVFALKDYKSAHGQYPDTLDALVPEHLAAIPVSPVTGEAPIYERDEDGFSIKHPSMFGPVQNGQPVQPDTLWHGRH